MKNRIPVSKNRNPGMYDVLALGILLFCIVIQGGYFPGGIAIVILAEVLMCIFKAIRPGKKHLLTGIFCVWYLVCGMRNGFVAENVARSLIPAGVFLFYLIYVQGVENKKWFRTAFIKSGLVIAAASVIICLWDSVVSGELKRCAFPFGYANVSGIFFGAMFMLCSNEETEGVRKGAWLYGVALVLTQSVGAIGVTLAGFAAMDYRRRSIPVIAVLALLAAVILRDRIYESMFTFVERLLHIRDGGLCMLKNPLGGIGVGQWEHTKHFYQTGFYTAKVIHSIPVIIGVSGGLPALVLFGAIIAAALGRTFREDRRRFWCGLALVCHMCMDFTLCYMSMGMLFALVTAKDKAEESVPVKWRGVGICCFGAVFLLTAFTGVCLMEARSLKNTVNRGEYLRALETCRQNPLATLSGEGSLQYMKAICLTGQKQRLREEVMAQSPRTTDMYILMYRSGDKEALADAMRTQPYNLRLYDEGMNSGDKELESLARDMRKNAEKNLSPIGKLLYDHRGENR